MAGSGSIRPFATTTNPLFPKGLKIDIRLMQLQTVTDKTVFTEAELIVYGVTEPPLNVPTDFVMSFEGTSIQLVDISALIPHTAVGPL